MYRFVPTNQGAINKLADAYCARVTLGFARRPPIQDAENSFGSGVLAQYKKVGGVLTCAHVVEAVVGQEAISIISNGARDGDRQSVGVDIGSLRRVVLKGDGRPEDGL